MPRPPIFTEEEIREIATDCSTRSNLKKKNWSAFNCANNHYPELLIELFGELKVRRKWTKENLVASIEKHTEFSEWRDENPGAYRAAKKICPEVLYERLNFKLNKRGYTEDEIIECALQCESPYDMEKKFNPQYQYALDHYPGLVADTIGYKYKTWDYDKMIAEAKKYKFKNDLIKANKYVYNTLLKQHVLDDLFEDQNDKPWTEERILNEVENYDTRGEFRYFKRSAYNAAYRLGILGKLHGLAPGGSENNRFYIWLSSAGWYKFGHTSRSLHTDRMDTVARAAKVEIVELHFWDVDRASDFENYVKKFGRPIADRVIFDGSSECRWFTDNEIKYILENVNNWAASEH